ncbi:hypothetical protein BG000_001467 [Podila horticola]|nr:hypothetical protein BG000_001467 [Podila horticola]
MPSLPPECLHLIVSHLAENNELAPLTTLLLVNRTVCQITLPYIYSNPFRLFEQNILGAKAVAKFRQLIHLLLTTSIPYDGYSDLLKAMYEIDDGSLNNTHSKPLKIKYLEYLRHFDLPQELVTLTSPKRETLNTFPRLSRYVDEHDLKQKFRTKLQETPYNWTQFESQGTTEDDNIISHLNMVVRRELSWVLCHPILDQLQSMAIPVSNLNIYHDNMDCLSSLKSIVFVLDDLLRLQEHTLDALTQENIEKIRLIREKRDRALGLMVEFVQFHTMRFRDVLRQVGESVPTIITLKNQSKESYGPAANASFLRRCRSLRELNIFPFFPETFKWAVQTRQEIACGANMDRILPPLDTVVLQAFWEPFNNEVDDVALAFGPTLKTLALVGTNELRFLALEHSWSGTVSYIPSITELEEAEQEAVEQDIELGPGRQDAENHTWLPRPRWTWDWYLPHLKDLALTGEFALRFQFRMLQGCPSVESLSLNIMSTNEDQVVRELTDADFTIDPSFQHPRLDQDQEKHRPISKSQDEWSLQDIEQALCMIHRETIEYLDHPHPAVAHKKEQAKHKAKVQSILNTIKEIPGVQHSVASMIRRLLANGSEDNVSVNGFQPTISLEETRLQVPSLQVLNMLGRWAICDAVLEIMLAQVFRNVRNLEEMYCTGFSTLKWLQLTQQMPWLLRAESRRALGMDPVPIEALPESLLTTHVQYIFDTRRFSFATV